jgi:hypothetical protein
VAFEAQHERSQLCNHTGSSLRHSTRHITSVSARLCVHVASGYMAGTEMSSTEYDEGRQDTG